jgi:hypothetical protein
MSDRALANVARINELWGLHKSSPEESPGTESLCLAFAIDRRYLDCDGVEMRLGVSFGHNPSPPGTKKGLLPIPAPPGKLVFGMHLVGTKGNQLAIYDKWMDAREAGNCADAVQGEKTARSMLALISDAEYLTLVSESPEDAGPLKVSGLDLLEEFEVVKEKDVLVPKA